MISAFISFVFCFLTETSLHLFEEQFCLCVCECVSVFVSVFVLGRRDRFVSVFVKITGRKLMLLKLKFD